MKRSFIRHLLLLFSMLAAASCFTGCETMESALYEPVPFDEVAKQQGITLAEAEQLNVQRPRAELQPIIQAATAFAPGYGQLASVALNGALGLGAVWLSSRKRTAEKVSASLVQGIDTFRDILDQTPQGERIDASLTKTLRDHQHALRVEQEIHKLLQRYGTPTKEPIRLESEA